MIICLFRLITTIETTMLLQHVCRLPKCDPILLVVSSYLVNSLQIQVQIIDVPSERQSKNTSDFVLFRAKMVGAKNMHSSSGWAVMSRVFPQVLRVHFFTSFTLSHPRNTVTITTTPAVKIERSISSLPIPFLIFTFPLLQILVPHGLETPGSPTTALWCLIDNSSG